MSIMFDSANSELIYDLLKKVFTVNVIGRKLSLKSIMPITITKVINNNGQRFIYDDIGRIMGIISNFSCETQSK